MSQSDHFSNSNNSCYLISILQILLSDPFSQYLDTDFWINCENNLSNGNKKDYILQFIKNMIELTNLLNNGDVKSKKITQLKNNIIEQLILHSNFMKNKQNDAHECFISICDMISEANDLLFLKGKIISELQIQCPQCNFLNFNHEIQEYFTDIALDIPEKNLLSIDVIISEYFSSFMEEINCPLCGTHKITNILSKKKLVEPPKILVLHFKRYHFKGNMIVKNETSVMHEEDISINDFDYHLFGSVEHIGKHATRGHYISYINKEGSWWNCNDSSIKKGNFFSFN